MFFFSNISGSALGQPVRNKPQSIQQRCDIEFLASLGPRGFSVIIGHRTWHLKTRISTHQISPDAEVVNFQKDQICQSH